MYNYAVNPELARLQAEHSSAVRKRTSGIVLTAIGADFLLTGIITIWCYGIGILFLIAMLPLLGVGIPNLVIGITRASKLNRRISQLKAQTNNTYVNTNPQFPAQQPVNYIAQNTAVPAQPVAQPSAPVNGNADNFEWRE